MHRPIPFILILMLCACADPHTQCVNRANAELKAIDEEITEIEVALVRGYRVKEGSRVTAGLGFCTSKNPVNVCLSTERPISERRLTIDPSAERARLRALKNYRPIAAQNAARASQSCPAPQ